MKLNDANGVVFREEDHTYWLGENELSGITSIINRYLFQRKYENVPPAILEKARIRGSEVHEQLEEGFLFDGQIFGTPRPEFLAYQQLAKDMKLDQTASEYLVSCIDEGIASKIDCVLKVDEKTVDLADYKTTYKLDKEYLSWQLSMYRHLFEMQNPGIKVRNLYGIHLRDTKAKLVEVAHIPEFAIQQLIFAYQVGAEHFDNPMKKDSS